MENSFKNLIEQAKSILVVLPLGATFDQVAAGLSLYLGLRENQKDVQVYSPTPMIVEFNRLVGVNKVSQEIGNKNLVIKFRDYKAMNIDRVSYDIEDAQFKLTVIPKDRAKPPRKEQIDISFSGSSCDLGILIGGMNESNFSVIDKELAGVQLIHLGIRDLIQIGGRSVISFAKPASSVSEVVCQIIKDLDYEIGPDLATNLLMGIEEGSNNFADKSVTSESFETIAMLMKSGGRRRSAFNIQKVNYPPGAIPGQPFPKSFFKKPKTSEGDDMAEQTPRDWLEPKVFKGTSVS